MKEKGRREPEVQLLIRHLADVPYIHVSENDESANETGRIVCHWRKTETDRSHTDRSASLVFAVMVLDSIF